MQPAISFCHVHKSFGALKAVDDIHFDIMPGEFFALLGPNGAGKTTLISILAGLVRQDIGQTSILGYDTLLQSTQAKRHIGVVPQELTFDPFFTIKEALYFQSGYFGLNHNQSWIDEVITRLALTDKVDVRIRKLSGGFKKRLMIAQALVHRPNVIVLDEPTAGVDIELRQSLWVFIRELNQMGHTILLTTHYLEEAEALCNRVAILKQGKLILLENKEKLLQRTKERIVTMRLSRALPTTFPAKWIYEEQTDNYVFHLDTLNTLADIMVAIRQSDIAIREIHIADMKLEDAFVTIMHQDDKK
ncbi:MAG: ABC transporter ATP-binding protein [Neisseriales bacterium]|nr:MAG: ABC transporter ATP-binding protein [Neisseriales bacterium]